MSGYTNTPGNQAPVHAGTTGTHPMQGDPTAAQVGLSLKHMHIRVAKLSRVARGSATLTRGTDLYLGRLFG